MTTDITLLQEDSQFTDSELQVFEEKYLSVMKGLADAVIRKKCLEEQEKNFKEQLKKVMDAYGIKSIDNKFLKIIRIAGSDGKQTIDIDKMQKEEPELYQELVEDYPKVTGKKKASIRFDVKGVMRIEKATLEFI